MGTYNKLSNYSLFYLYSHYQSTFQFTLGKLTEKKQTSKKRLENRITV